jgi:manganese transport protein
VTLLLIAIIGISFVVEISLARPDWGDVVRGFVPGLDFTTRATMRGSLYVAIAMLGATVMPHNLYLHSALVQTRLFAPNAEGKRLACRYNLFDSLLALNGAFFVNAAILILAVTTFYGRPEIGDDVEVTLQDAHYLLGHLGAPLASVLFAVALLASGQSSTLTGTLAGQVVMEGFVHLRVRPWVRRLITRLVAILPAMAVVTLAGAAANDVDRSLLDLLVLSQVILSFQLPFAIVPLVQFTSDRKRMNEFASGWWMTGLSWSCAAIVLVLNGVLLYFTVDKWADSAAEAGWSPFWIYGSAGPVAAGLGAFLCWLTLYPSRAKADSSLPPALPATLPGVRYHRIGVAVEFVAADEAVLTLAAALSRAHDA